MLQDNFERGIDFITNKGYKFFCIGVLESEDIYNDSVKSTCTKNKVGVFEFKGQYYLFKINNEVSTLAFLKGSITDFTICRFGLVVFPCSLILIGLTYIGNGTYSLIAKTLVYLAVFFISFKFGIQYLRDFINIFRCKELIVKDNVYYTLKL